MPFYENEQSITFVDSANIQTYLQTPFLIDMYWQQLTIPAPWQEIEGEAVEEVLHFWKKNESLIAKHFNERNKSESSKLMKIHIAAFIDFLFWSNHQHVKSLQAIFQTIAQLRIKPVNCMERLEYIMTNNNHYQAFVQLQQLYTEAYKAYMKEKTRKKV
jgi:hypothetical protein